MRKSSASNSRLPQKSRPGQAMLCMLMALSAIFAGCAGKYTMEDIEGRYIMETKEMTVVGGKIMNIIIYTHMEIKGDSIIFYPNIYKDREFKVVERETGTSAENFKYTLERDKLVFQDPSNSNERVEFFLLTKKVVNTEIFSIGRNNGKITLRNNYTDLVYVKE